MALLRLGVCGGLFDKILSNVIVGQISNLRLGLEDNSTVLRVTAKRFPPGFTVEGATLGRMDGCRKQSKGVRMRASRHRNGHVGRRAHCESMRRVKILDLEGDMGV